MIASLSYGSASLPELIWTLFGLVGLRFKIPNAITAKKAISAVIALNGRNLLGHDDMMLLAKNRLRREKLRILESVTIISIGVGFMLTPSTTTVGRHFTPGQLILTCGLFVIELIDITASFYDKQTSDVLLRERSDER